VSADAICRQLRLILSGVIQTAGKRAAGAGGAITVTYKVTLPRGSVSGRAHVRSATAAGACRWCCPGSTSTRGPQLPNDRPLQRRSPAPAGPRQPPDPA
jgi:hypothetical protein